METDQFRRLSNGCRLIVPGVAVYHALQMDKFMDQGQLLIGAGKASRHTGVLLAQNADGCGLLAGFNGIGHDSRPELLPDPQVVLEPHH